MKQSIVAAALALAVVPLGAGSQDKADTPSESRDITHRGCVGPGTDKDTFVMTHVT